MEGHCNLPGLQCPHRSQVGTCGGAAGPSSFTSETRAGLRPRDRGGDLATSQGARESALLPQMVELIGHHRRACPAYARVLDAIGHSSGRRYAQTRELPWLPVRLFKEHALISTGREQVAVLTSSGTTGANVSRIALDRDSAEHQRGLLTATLAAVLGPRRLPLLIVDSPSAVRRERSSIRGATVLGVMNVGREHVFALEDEQSIDAAAVENFLQRHGHATFLIFGFTSLVWTRFYAFARSRGFDLANAILLHTGGWKKLADLAVSPREFRAGFLDATGLRRFHKVGTPAARGVAEGNVECAGDRRKLMTAWRNHARDDFTANVSLEIGSEFG